MEVESRFRTAIVHRRPVAVQYKRPGRRRVHPHALFLTSAGKTCVNGFQLDGPTEPGHPLPGWRQLELDDVGELEVLGDTFEIQPDFNPDGAMYQYGLLESVR